MDNNNNKQLTENATRQFQEGITLVFSKWWALQMAVENSWGGPHSRNKALEFASRAFAFFYQPDRKEPLYIDDLEKLLQDGLDTFNTTADDGSVEEVAEKLMIMYEECLEENYQSIQKLRDVRFVPVPIVRQDANDSDEEEEEEDVASDMMVDSTAPTTHSAKSGSTIANTSEQEDGWIQVTSRKNRGHRN